jgi:hypothetical protein
MNPEIRINERVEILAMYRQGVDVSQISYPAKMKWRHEEITFARLNLRHPTAKGKRMIHVFDVSDGVNDYRLEFDAEALTWELVAMVEGSRVRPQ